MAILYRAELHPTKLEMLNDWVPLRPWYHGPASPELRRVVSFRFDDPRGQVGVETLLVQTEGGPILQVPLTYRGAPVDDLEPWLVGTTEHSVLGTRWVYDGCVDPVYISTLAHAILTGGSQAEEFIDADGQMERREPGVTVRGSGTADGDLQVGGAERVDEGDPTVIQAGGIELRIVRVLGGLEPQEQLSLTAAWDGQPNPALLAYARRS